MKLKAFAILILCAVALTGCKSSKKAKVVKATVETVGLEKPVAPLGVKGVRGGLVRESLSWIGTPYRYGGNDKEKGVDCSGMVVQVYEKVAGIKLPRQSFKQADYCRRIKEKQVRPGDLVFFATGRDKGRVSHVGIVIEGDRFVHSSGSKGVIVSELSAPYYRRTFMMFGQVPELEE